MVKSHAHRHKCHNWDSNPHSAQQKHQSLNSELLTARPRHFHDNVSVRYDSENLKSDSSRRNIIPVWSRLGFFLVPSSQSYHPLFLFLYVLGLFIVRFGNKKQKKQNRCETIFNFEAKCNVVVISSGASSSASKKACWTYPSHIHRSLSPCLCSSEPDSAKLLNIHQDPLGLHRTLYTVSDDIPLC